MNILSDKIVLIRKTQRCDACGRSFEKGTEMRVQVNTFDGFNTWRECPTCRKLLSYHRNLFADPIDDICYEGCVADYLEKGQTPEDLLKTLENENNL